MATNSYGWASPTYSLNDSSRNQTNQYTAQNMQGVQDDFQRLQARAANTGSSQSYNPTLDPYRANDAQSSTARGGGIAYQGTSYGQPMSQPTQAKTPSNLSLTNMGGPQGIGDNGRNPFPLQGNGYGSNTYGGGQPSNPSYGTAFNNMMSNTKYSDPNSYESNKTREAAAAFGNYATQFGNLYMADRTQGLNEWQSQANFGETQLNNQRQYELAQQAAALEQQGFSFSQNKFAQELALNRESFNANTQQGQQRLDQEYQARMAEMNSQNVLGQGRNRNEAMGLQYTNQNNIARNANEAYAAQQQAKYQQGQLGLGQEQNRLTGQRDMWDYNTNMQRVGNEKYNAETGRYEAETGRTRTGNDFTLGQGQLGFQNRQLDVTSGFNDRQLAQEAELTRQRLANEMQSARYGAYGRAQAPSARVNRSWN